jgi:hypothetical protein
MQVTHPRTAPWPITILVACLPVLVLGLAAVLAHMVMRERHLGRR